MLISWTVLQYLLMVVDTGMVCVEDVLLEPLEGLLVLLALEPLVLSEEHPNREDHTHTLVVVFVVVVRICDAVDALELVRVPSSF